MNKVSDPNNLNQLFKEVYADKLLINAKSYSQLFILFETKEQKAKRELAERKEKHYEKINKKIDEIFEIKEEKEGL